MSTNPVVARMLWKEFCSLRMVWIACVLGVLFLNATVTVSAAAYHWTGISGVFWALVFVVPAAYVVACTAMTFAGEREDRTADWLVALAPPFEPLYLSKQLFILVSGLAMQVFLAVAAACFQIADRNASYSGYQTSDVLETLRMSEFVFLECLVWGTFWSLQTGKAVNAIFKTIATLIVIFCVSGFAMDWSRMHNGTTGFWYRAFETFGWLRTTWTLGIALASVALGRRWLEGRGIEWETVLAKWFQRRVPKARPAVLERGEPWQRTWQRLWWLERQSLRTFGWMTLAAALLSLPSILFGPQPTLAWMISFCCLLILTGGLLSWRSEQTRHHYRLLVNFGATPRAVWTNKLLMWFLATLLAVAVVALPTLGLWQWLSAAFPIRTAGYGPRWPRISLSTGMHNQNPQVLWDAYAVSGCYALMLFAAAFTWSLLCRKAVIGFGMALITLCLLSPWYGIVTQLGMPMWVFLAPLPVWLIWVSHRHLTAWWLEHTGWRVWLVRGLELTLVPAVLMLGAMAYRVYEIPWLSYEVVFPAPNLQPDPQFAQIMANNAAAWNRVVAAVQALPDFDPHPEEGGMAGMAMGGAVEEPAAPEVVADPKNEAPSAVMPENEPPPSRFDEWIAANQQPLEELRTAVEATKGLMNPEGAIWQRVTYAGGLGQWNLAISALARQATLTVPSDSESAAWLQAAVRLGGAIRRYAPFYQEHSLQQTNQPLFAEMIAWAQHPAQTAETLQQGLERCSKNLYLWRMTGFEARANADWLRAQTIDRAYWPWEEARRQRLLQIAAINQTTYLSQVQSEYTAASLNPTPTWERRPHQLRAWDVTPGEDRVRYAYLSPERPAPVVGLDTQTITLLHDAETRYRATVATMAVVGYRRLHGRLPVALTEAATVFGEQSAQPAILHDPWSHGWFHYEPKGIALPPEASETPLKQPLLWSGGPYHYEIRPIGNEVFLQSTVPGTYSRHRITDPNLRDVYIFPIPPQTP